MKAAFTLVETLVVFTVVAVLVAIAIPATNRVSQYSARVKSISNMRQIGVAALLYANDHNQQLPGHVSDLGLPLDSGGTWPQLFCQYLSPTDPRVFLDPSDKQTARLAPSDVLSQQVNNTGYIYNGFDDLGDGQQPVGMVPLTRVQNPSQVILLAPKSQGATEVFYADLLLAPLTNLLSAFNPSIYNEGASYLFADGSVRFLKQSEYSNNFWLSDKSVPLPTLPLPPLNCHNGLASNAPTWFLRSPGLADSANWR